MMTNPEIRVAGFGLSLVALAIFGQTVSFEFLSVDDPAYVVDNPYVREGLSWTGIKWAMTTPLLGHWHPATHVSYMLDATLFGLNPAGFHLTNLLLHMANSFLLFVVLARLTKAHWPSLFVAAVFAAHPLHVESVAWIAERKDVLSAFFALLTLVAYEKWVRTSSRIHYVLALVAFLLAITSKAIVVTLPCVLLLLDYWPLDRFKNPKPNALRKIAGLFAEKIPFFAISAAASAATVWASVETHAGRGLSDLSISYRLANACVSYGTYLLKTFWPTNLAAFYPHLGDDLPTASVLASSILLAIISIAAVVVWKRCPYVIVGWLWFLGMVVPVSGMFQVGDQALADRYMYFPLIGLTIAVAWSIRELAERYSISLRARAWVSVLAIAALALLAWRQTSYWRDTITLYEHALAVTPDNAMTRQILANSYLLEGRAAEAELHYVAALEINPDHPDWRNGLGYALLLQEKTDNAEREFHRVLEIDPNHADAWNNLGILHLEAGRYAEATDRFRRVVSLRPGYEGPLVNLAIALAGTGDYEEAERRYSEALAIDPESMRARSNLSAMLITQERFEEARRHLDIVLERHAQHEQAKELYRKLPDP